MSFEMTNSVANLMHCSTYKQLLLVVMTMMTVMTVMTAMFVAGLDRLKQKIHSTDCLFIGLENYISGALPSFTAFEVEPHFSSKFLKQLENKWLQLYVNFSVSVF